MLKKVLKLIAPKPETPNEKLTLVKNGYVYLSNESQNIAVYFDDMQVSHTRSPMVEDNAYYPFGLKIQGISARAALKPQNKFGYQGDFSEQDEETSYNEFALRNFDAQTGRWIQRDSYNEFHFFAKSPEHRFEARRGTLQDNNYNVLWSSHKSFKETL